MRMVHVASLAWLALAAPAFAQKLVDPNAVAPEYREAAEKRRAEQIRHLLPPKVGGVLAILEGAPDADVLVVTFEF